jgi:hypothetical protein
VSNPPLCDNCETEVADPSHYEESWNSAGVQGEDGVYCSPTCRKEAEESAEFPISIGEFHGSRTISVKTSIAWTTLSRVSNKGFIPSSDLLQEVIEETINQLSKDLEDYDLGEHDSKEIGKARIIPDDQELVSVEVDI